MSDIYIETLNKADKKALKIADNSSITIVGANWFYDSFTFYRQRWHHVQRFYFTSNNVKDGNYIEVAHYNIGMSKFVVLKRLHSERLIALNESGVDKYTMKNTRIMALY